ncbi:hypothetical protein DOTSEDRAFT_67819 [Dothistroma septosporum NZE10]|uniref:ABC transmembrane type-1 domain-containing protein n=1 Tax=Dothistroma septosporum (strain NZE10 / CBS 128990) TaxID=675120 RepID=N1PZC4_DOTSN|nr:hypothetical protein DOTSEDRAFT_67819 [Dothistroma septosporum NZE10]
MQSLLQTLSSMHLELAGLLALASLDHVAHRTAIKGTSSLLDIFVIAPGMHRQLRASDLSKGEFPACAAMTTGYVFRVENEATVLYLQNVGRTGHLTTLTVKDRSKHRRPDVMSSVSYFSAALLSIAVLYTLLTRQDWYAVSSIVFFMFARLANTTCIKRRATPGWFGQSEHGVKSALLVLLSRDRWVRIEGDTDDVKAVTSGSWLREPTSLESTASSAAALLVYLAAILVANASTFGQLLILVLLLGSAMLLGIANASTSVLSMKGRIIKVKSPPVEYTRRLALAKELVAEFKRTDCFVAMGMIQPSQEEELQKSYKGAVVM